MMIIATNSNTSSLVMPLREKWKMVKSLHHFLIPSIITSIILSSPHQVEVGEQPSDSPALEMRSQEEMEEVEVNKKEEEEEGEEEEGESVAVASVPSTSIKMPDLGPTSLAVNDICTSCIHRCGCHQLNHQYQSHHCQHLFEDQHFMSKLKRCL